MKKLVCELCGSGDMIKKDGYYICQACETKYSVEEAKKMMIEGTVDVSGSTVKVDNSASIKNFYTMAVSAYEAENKTEAENYCNKIIEIEPENYEAWFLKGKAAGWQSTLAKLRIEESVQCFSKAIDYAPEDKIEEIKKQAADEISKLSIALVSLCCNNFTKYPDTSNANSVSTNAVNTQMYALQLIKKCGITATEFNGKIATLINSAVCDAWPSIIKNYQGDDGHPSKYEWERFTTACDNCIALLELAVKIDDEVPKNNIQRYNNLIQITEAVIKSCSWTREYVSGKAYWSKEWSLTNAAREKRIDKIMGYHNKIKELDSNYVIPERPSVKSLTKGGGCYVATCVYGSYDCPQVWTLRRYRDYTLAETWYGRAFIHIYYAISPTIVKLFGNTNWFKKMWKGKLDKMVADLQSKGIKSTPYKDKNW
ncbi:MAG: TFIIB-type zinc finger domain-containing protein [Ruminococcus sp.]|nr:TFIIB-type zinc finger domain-containing protein [Ruminococcus sp.]